MRTLQYCYFALKSTTMSAEAITNQLLMQPDEIAVMGSRHPEHRLPAATHGRSFDEAPRVLTTRYSTSLTG